MESHTSHEGHVVGHHSVSLEDAKNVRALKITTWLTGIYFLIELALGIYSGSVAVISDAFHTFSAVGGVVLALIAGKIALKPSDKYKTFGYLRAEIVGALLNGVFLLGMALLVLYMGYMRLRNPVELPVSIMLLSAAGGIITEVISIKLLYSGQKENLNVKGAFWHVIQTFVGSVIIIIAALVIKFTGFLAIDPILGMLFGVILLYVSWGIIKESLEILLEATPKGIDLDEVRRELEAVKGVRNVHHIHAWTLTSGKNVFSAHIKIEDLKDFESVFKKAHDILKNRYGFYFSTLQLERECPDEGEAEHIDITRNRER
ncbi:cation diffusion facilitator family transporter [Hydrogenivirga sp.]